MGGGAARAVQEEDGGEVGAKGALDWPLSPESTAAFARRITGRIAPYPISAIRREHE